MAYRMSRPSGQARLSPDTLLCFGVQIKRSFTGNRDGSGFRRVVELAMASVLPDLNPAVLSQ
jgi:hypothetical protein